MAAGLEMIGSQPSGMIPGEVDSVRLLTGQVSYQENRPGSRTGRWASSDLLAERLLPATQQAARKLVESYREHYPQLQGMDFGDVELRIINQAGDGSAFEQRYRK